MKLTKKELIESIAEHAKLTKTSAEVALDAVVAGIQTELLRGNDVSIPHIGTFQVAIRKARNGRNPATGESITIPAKKAVRFKVAADLKRVIAE